MKKQLATTLLCAAAALSMLSPQAFAQRGEKTMGVRGGYSSYNRTATAGIWFDYRFSKHFSVAPSIDYLFRNNDYDGLIFNLDTHYPFALGRFEAYPIAGVAYSSWTSHHTDYETNDDVSSRVSRIGINAGVGLSINATSTLKLSLEGRYNGISRYNSAIVTLGIGYTF